MGRPTKFTDETTKKIIEAISVGATYEHACAYAGVSYVSFNAWMKKGEAAPSGQFLEFFKSIKEAEAKAVLKWSALIDKAATNGEWQAAAWKLERRYPNIYGKRVHEHQHDFSKMTDEQLRNYINTSLAELGKGDRGGEEAGA